MYYTRKWRELVHVDNYIYINTNHYTYIVSWITKHDCSHLCIGVSICWQLEFGCLNSCLIVISVPSTSRIFKRNEWWQMCLKSITTLVVFLFPVFLCTIKTICILQIQKYLVYISHNYRKWVYDGNVVL